MIALLFAGQGSQRAGMLRDCAHFPGAREIFDAASEVLGVNVFDYDDASSLEDTAIVQRNVFLAGVAYAAALQKGGVAPDIAAGHSIGAFAAATVARVFSLRDALRVVTVRGRAMATALGSGYGMGAILGLREREVQSLVAATHRRGAEVAIAAVNAPDQIVVSGSDRSVDDVLAAAAASGARGVRRLSVPTASHTSLMDRVSGRLAEVFASIDASPPRFPLAANVDGRALFRAPDVVADLIAGVSAPVRWFDATQMLVERGATIFIECSLGDTLTVLAEAAFSHVRAVSLARTALDDAILVAQPPRA